MARPSFLERFEVRSAESRLRMIPHTCRSSEVFPSGFHGLVVMSRKSASCVSSSAASRDRVIFCAKSRATS